MRRSLVTLLIAFVLAAASFTPVCEISCCLAPDGTAPVGAFSKAAPGHCHESAGEDGSGRRSSNEHPCKKGVHHRAELSLSRTVSTQIQSASHSDEFGGLNGSLALSAASTAAHESAWEELLFPPAHRLSPLFLRI